MKFGNDSEIEILKYSSNSKNLLIMLPSEHGITDGLKTLAKDINQKNTEVWIADPFSSFFLIPASSSLKKIPIESYVQIIKEAQKTKKNIYLFSNDKGASVLLDAAHKWQTISSNIISGVILVSPDLYKKTPKAGDEGSLLPVTKITNLPISIFVPEKSTLNLRVNKLDHALKVSGSDVVLNSIKNVRNRFFFREDASDNEKKFSNTFSSDIIKSMNNIKKYAKKRDVAAINTKKVTKEKKTTGMLNDYTGKLTIQDFTLKDLSNNTHSLSQYKGKVVLLNFWASWCPPCVHEMPSMSQLSAKFKNKPFSILALNLGESSQSMQKFINKYHIKFPILLDPGKSQAKKWNVYAFPTSFIIDKKGKIRYSIAGGFDWNTQEAIDIITTLTKE